MLDIVQNDAFKTCSASTTASNSGRPDKSDIFHGEVMCDWLSFRHEFGIDNQQEPINSGRTIKINRDGEIKLDVPDFDVIRCASSDTSFVVKCDGNSLKFSGNIGRFQEQDNRQGLTVIQCFEKAATYIRDLYPHLDLSALGTIQRQGTISEYGTYLTRLDLTSNFYTDEYLQLSQSFLQTRINRKLPRVGKYGPTWGYDAKRGQYWKAKLYDKDAELEGKRTPNPKATTARFEIQLGSEYLRQNNLNHLIKWKQGEYMENIIYGKFANQLLKEKATASDLLQLPAKLRQHAVLYMNGTDPKSYLSKSQYYDVRKRLLEHGLDISNPCNVMTLTQRVKTIELRMLPTLRKAA